MTVADSLLFIVFSIGGRRPPLQIRFLRNAIYLLTFKSLQL
jgi:hypothetical protein